MLHSFVRGICKMDYKAIINDIESSQHLISLTPIEKVVEIGYTAGMNLN
jgi:hypothetical protein